MEKQSDQPLNICRYRTDPGTDPGYLFGPIAFITIPIGNIIGGAMHDYFSGMICLRDGGTQMPDMIRRYSNKGGIYGISDFLQSAASSGRSGFHLIRLEILRQHRCLVLTERQLLYLHG